MQIKTTDYFEIIISDELIPLLDAASKGTLTAKDIANNLQQLTKITDEQGFTVLHLAACNGQQNQVALLLNKGFSSNLKSKTGFTPLHLAAHNGHLELVKFLIDNGANLQAKNDNALTPLHMATSGNQAEVVEYLILRGARINEKDYYGFTSLHVSAYYGHEKTIEMLMEYGADCTLRNIKGETPAKVAINNDQHRVAGLFMHMQIEQLSAKQLAFLKKNNRAKSDKKILEPAALES